VTGCGVVATSGCPATTDEQPATTSSMITRAARRGTARTLSRASPPRGVPAELTRLFVPAGRNDPDKNSNHDEESLPDGKPDRPQLAA
jgi:hypothetical protein